MAIWANIRRLAYSATVQGVQNPGPLEILTPAQSVQIMDDASHAVAPVLVPRVWIQGLGGATAPGDFSGVEIQGREGGCVIEAISPSVPTNDNLAFWRDDDQATITRVAMTSVTTLGVPNLEAPRCGYFNVLVNALPAFQVGFPLAFESPRIDLYVGPGERVFFVNPTANAIILFLARIREIPHTRRVNDA